jgi:hypothetical protein
MPGQGAYPDRPRNLLISCIAFSSLGSNQNPLNQLNCGTLPVAQWALGGTIEVRPRPGRGGFLKERV